MKWAPTISASSPPGCDDLAILWLGYHRPQQQLPECCVLMQEPEGLLSKGRCSIQNGRGHARKSGGEHAK